MKTYLSLSLAFLVVLPLSGCFDEFATAYDGPTVVEFDQVAGRYSSSVNEGSGNVSLVVNLIGPPQGSDITVSVAVVDSLTTATEGTNYSFPNGPQVTIPANSNSGSFMINVPTSGLAVNERRTIGLDLGSSTDGSIEGADNLDDFVLTIVGPAPPPPPARR